MSPPHSRLSRRYLLHFRLPALPLCPLASTPEPVPPLSPPYYLHITSTFPSVPPLSPPLQYVPRRAVASIHSRLSRRCLLTFPSVRSAPVAHPSTPSLSVVPMSPPSTPVCPATVFSTPVCPAAVASIPHPSLSRRCRLYSRLSRRCRLHSTPVSVPPLSPPLHTRLCPAAAASTPVCPAAVASTPLPSVLPRSPPFTPVRPASAACTPVTPMPPLSPPLPPVPTLSSLPSVSPLPRCRLHTAAASTPVCPAPLSRGRQSAARPMRSRQSGALRSGRQAARQLPARPMQSRQAAR